MAAGLQADQTDLPTSTALASTFSLFGAGAAHPLVAGDTGTHCQCDRCAHWAAFVKAGGIHCQPRYLIPTRDLIDSLRCWLIAESQRFGDAAMRVLEVGAGDGALTFHLRAALAATNAPISVVASDNMARGLRPRDESEFLVLDVDAALAQCEPHIVLCAFMPLGVDWTAVFRACASVRQYVLLGETDDGCCGRPWATHGYLCDGDDDAAFLDVSSTSGESSADDDESMDGDEQAAAIAPVPRRADPRQREPERSRPDGEAWRRVYEYEPHRTPFGAAGWSRAELREVSACLLCCTDTCWSATRHAKALVFARGPPPTDT